MLAFVSTGGKTRGCEKPAGLEVDLRVAGVVAAEMLGPLAERTPIAARAAASISADKVLALMSSYENQTRTPYGLGRGAGVGRGDDGVGTGVM